ncbi:hypothetical protein, partial [Paracraurococcus lichenis]
MTLYREVSGVVTRISYISGAVLESDQYASINSPAAWVSTADATASGGLAMLAGTAGGILSYSVDFSDIGTYWVTLRGKGTGNLDQTNAVSLALGGATQTDNLGWSLGYSWNSAQGAMPVTIVKPGVYTLTVTSVDTGFALDEISVQSAATTRPGDGRAQRAADFLDSLGVNTHIGYVDTAYANSQLVFKELNYLGVHNIRDGVAGPSMDYLINNGIKMLVVADRRGDAYGPNWLLGQLEAHATGILGVEGPNESDNPGWEVTYKGEVGLPALAALQADLYRAVHASTALNSNGKVTPVIGPSLGWSAQDQVGDLGAFADYANLHSYAQNGDAPSLSLANGLAQVQHSVDGKAVWITETGYDSNATAYWGVSEAVQGKYTPRVYLTDFVEGSPHTFVYELMDWKMSASGADTGGSGLFEADGTPRPAAVQLHNLTTELADTGAQAAGFTPGELHYVLSGMPSSGEDLLLQRSDGTFLLVLWNDVKGWSANASNAQDLSTHADLAVASVPISITLPAGYKAQALYDTQSGTSTALSDPLHPSLNLPDNAVVLEIVRTALGETPPAPADVT